MCVANVHEATQKDRPEVARASHPVDGRDVQVRMRMATEAPLVGELNRVARGVVPRVFPC